MKKIILLLGIALTACSGNDDSKEVSASCDCYEQKQFYDYSARPGDDVPGPYNYSNHGNTKHYSNNCDDNDKVISQNTEFIGSTGSGNDRMDHFTIYRTIVICK